MPAVPLPGSLEQLARHENYLASDPANPALLAQVIDLSLAAGDPARALQHADRALQAHPADTFFLYRRAHALMAQLQWDAAAAVLAALPAVHTDAAVATSLAVCLQRLDRHADALDVLGACSADLALDATGMTTQLRCLHHVGRLADAIALAEQHHDRFANEADFLAAASLVYLDEGDLARATALSTAALAHGACPLEAQVVQATLALAQEDSALAIAQFEAVLAEHPGEGRSWSGLGMASLMQQDLQAASVQLDKAMRLMPGHIGTVHALGWCKIFSQQLDAAELLFRQALALDRNFGESHGALAVVAALKGQRGEAEASIELARRLDPQGLSAQYARMVLAGQTADPERFRALAFKLMAGHKTATGASLADVVRRHAPGPAGH